MKKKFLALLLALATAFSLAVPAFAAVSSNFDDVPESHWAYYSINWCADFGFVNGVGNRRFAPENTLTGAQFSVMIARAFYSGKVDAEKKDSDNWYAAEMRVLEAIGIYDLSDSAGEKRTLMEDETVGLSRYQMAVMVANVLGGVEKVKEKDINTATEKVSDAMDDPLYGPYVVRCVSVGLLNGYEDGMFHGENTLTRAQAATVICNLWRGYEYYLEQ